MKPTLEDIKLKLLPPLDFADVGDARGLALHNRILTNFENTDFSGCVLYKCFPSGLGGLEIDPAQSEESLRSFAGYDFRSMTLSGLDFRGLDFRGANFGSRDTFINHINFRESSLENVNFNSTNLYRINLIDADIEGIQTDSSTKFNFVLTTDREFANRCRYGVTFIGPNEGLQHKNLESSDLSGVNLSGSFFNDSSFVGSDLRSANLEGAQLLNTNFGRSDLRGANLQRVCAIRANFYSSDLRGVDFRNSNLRRANLSYARLEGADLRDTDLKLAEFSGAQYTAATLFPEGFSVERKGMILIAEF